MDSKLRNRELVKSWREKNADKLEESIQCECGGRYFYQNISNHRKTQKPSTFLKFQRMLVNTLDNKKLNIHRDYIFLYNIYSDNQR